jgi:hypothetical protein
MQQVLRHAAEHDARQRRVSAAAEHDQIRIDPLGELGQLLGRRPAPGNEVDLGLDSCARCSSPSLSRVIRAA